VRGLKLVGDCLFETGPLQIGDGIDGELDVVFGGSGSFEELTVVVVLAASRVVRIRCGDGLRCPRP
jgi:hypothetical protein